MPGRTLTNDLGNQRATFRWPTIGHFVAAGLRVSIKAGTQSYAPIENPTIKDEDTVLVDLSLILEFSPESPGTLAKGGAHLFSEGGNPDGQDTRIHHGQDNLSFYEV